MTSVVGILCKDGVVIGADSSVSLDDGRVRTIEQPYENKIDIIENSIIVVGTGPMGLGQRFCEVIHNAWSNKRFRGTPLDIAKVLCAEAIKDFVSTSAPKGEYGALVGFPLTEGGISASLVLEIFNQS